MDQVSDPSFYYVCEKGQLYTPHSKRRRAFESCSSLSWKRFKSDENKGSDYGATMSDQLTSPQLITEVASLRSITISFVARHILSVESLVCFPELIGKELFLEVSRFGLLSTPSKTCTQILKLFSNAYGSSVAEELSFDSKVSSVEFCFEPLTSFEHLTKLDLGGCKLWNIYDECLAFISSLSSLKYLSLRSTGIDNDGLRMLTTVIAVYKKGLLQLKVLDLSCNPLINQKSLQFLHRFPALKALNLSNTNLFSISLEEQKNLHLTLLSDNLEYPFAKISVEKKGWVAGVINDWIADEVRRVNARATSRSQKPSITQTAQDRLNAGSFYRRSKASYCCGIDNSILVDQAKPNTPLAHSKLSFKSCIKFTSKDCTTNVRTVHLVSTELIEEIKETKRIKDLSDPSTGRAAIESAPVSCAAVKVHSSGKTLSQCATRRTAAENHSKGSENTCVSQYLSSRRKAVPDSAAGTSLMGEVTVVRKMVSLDAKHPLSTHHEPVNHRKSMNRDLVHEPKTNSKSLWTAMNSGLW